MNEQQRAVLISGVIVLIIMVGAILLGVVMDSKFPYSCDIGSQGVVGDYKESGLGSQRFGYIENNQCAIADCVAFNKLNGETRCAV
jgi:hypothetical protein